MKKLLKRFWQEEDGLGTVEIVILIAVLWRLPCCSEMASPSL